MCPGGGLPKLVRGQHWGSPFTLPRSWARTVFQACQSPQVVAATVVPLRYRLDAGRSRSVVCRYRTVAECRSCSVRGGRAHNIRLSAGNIPLQPPLSHTPAGSRLAGCTCEFTGSGCGINQELASRNIDGQCSNEMSVPTTRTGRVREMCPPAEVALSTETLLSAPA